MYLRPYSGDKFKAILFYEQLHREHVLCTEKHPFQDAVPDTGVLHFEHFL